MCVIFIIVNHSCLSVTYRHLDIVFHRHHCSFKRLSQASSSFLPELFTRAFSCHLDIVVLHLLTTPPLNFLSLFFAVYDIGVGCVFFVASSGQVCFCVPVIPGYCSVFPYFFNRIVFRLLGDISRFCILAISGSGCFLS